MQAGFRDLTFWSFLMASAHGAGLMVVPVLLGSNTVEAANQMTGHHMAASPLVGLVATVIHTTAYLGVMGILAWVVYRKFGLALLRKARFNFGRGWNFKRLKFPHSKQVWSREALPKRLYDRTNPWTELAH